MHFTAHAIGWIGLAEVLLDRSRVPQLPNKERAAISFALCSALVAAMDRAAHIDDANKAALGDRAKQVPWEAPEAETLELAFPGKRRKKMQHEQDEARGRDLEALQEAAYPEQIEVDDGVESEEIEEIAAEGMAKLRERGEAEAVEALCAALEDDAIEQRPCDVWKTVSHVIGKMVSDSKIANEDKKNALVDMARLAWACHRRENLAEQEDPNATRWVLFDGHSDGKTFAATCTRCGTERESSAKGAWSTAAIAKLRGRLTDPKNQKRSDMQCSFCNERDKKQSECMSCGAALVKGENVSNNQWSKRFGQRKCTKCTGNQQQSASSQVDSRVDMSVVIPHDSLMRQQDWELTFSDDLLKWLPRNCQEEPRS